MFSKLKSINITLLLILIVQVWWLVAETPVQAQTTPFLKRPYYGGGDSGLTVSAMFDHWCPDYADRPQGPIPGSCTADPYTINGITSNGNFRFLKWDGQTPPIVCPSSNCYSGHSGVDFNMAYQPVVAAAAGQVVYAGWQFPDHESSLGLMMTLDHNNNHRTSYGHLSMVRYMVGRNITGNWQIGTSGATGNSTGPHLHFEVEFKIGNNWYVKDPYGAPSVDPWHNFSTVVSEWLWINPPSARINQPPTYYGDYTLDNDDNSNFTIACNAGFGAANCPYWWYVNNNGYGSDLRYTLANGVTIDYWARWFSPNLPSTGQYEVEVYLTTNSNPGNRTHAARYEIYHQSGSEVVVVDQHAISSNTWVSLGRYNFTSGTNGYVLVSDAAYISNNHTDPTNRAVVADAVRWRKTH